jgi:hypothetical protein
MKVILVVLACIPSSYAVCSLGDRACQVVFGSQSHCKHWLLTPLCQGSETICACDGSKPIKDGLDHSLGLPSVDCSAANFMCRVISGNPESYCKYWSESPHCFGSPRVKCQCESGPRPPSTPQVAETMGLSEIMPPRPSSSPTGDIVSTSTETLSSDSLSVSSQSRVEYLDTHSFRPTQPVSSIPSVTYTNLISEAPLTGISSEVMGSSINSDSTVLSATSTTESPVTTLVSFGPSPSMVVAVQSTPQEFEIDMPGESEVTSTPIIPSDTVIMTAIFSQESRLEEDVGTSLVVGTEASEEDIGPQENSDGGSDPHGIVAAATFHTESGSTISPSEAIISSDPSSPIVSQDGNDSGPDPVFLSTNYVITASLSGGNSSSLESAMGMGTDNDTPASSVFVIGRGSPETVVEGIDEIEDHSSSDEETADNRHAGNAPLLWRNVSTSSSDIAPSAGRSSTTWEEFGRDDVFEEIDLNDGDPSNTYSSVSSTYNWMGASASRRSAYAVNRGYGSGRGRLSAGSDAGNSHTPHGLISSFFPSFSSGRLRGGGFWV